MPSCVSHMCFSEGCECRHGLVTYMSFWCTKCRWEKRISHTYATSSRALNARAILASRLCGLGRSGTEVLCGMLGLPTPVFECSYHTKTKKICRHLDVMVEKQQKECANKLYIELGHNPDDDVDVMIQ